MSWVAWTFILVLVLKHPLCVHLSNEDEGAKNSSFVLGRFHYLEVRETKNKRTQAYIRNVHESLSSHYTVSVGN